LHRDFNVAHARLAIDTAHGFGVWNLRERIRLDARVADQEIRSWVDVSIFTISVHDFDSQKAVGAVPLRPAFSFLAYGVLLGAASINTFWIIPAFGGAIAFLLIFSPTRINMIARLSIPFAGFAAIMLVQNWIYGFGGKSLWVIGISTTP
jgi:hypothetical protein